MTSPPSSSREQETEPFQALDRALNGTDISTDKISDRLPSDKHVAGAAVHVIADDHSDVRREVIFAERNAQGVDRATNLKRHGVS
jgi:hypothetical protein